MKFTVEVTEVLQGIEFDVIADSKEQAIEIIKEKYFREEIILDAENYVETRFEVI